MDRGDEPRLPPPEPSVTTADGHLPRLRDVDDHALGAHPPRGPWRERARRARLVELVGSGERLVVLMGGRLEGATSLLAAVARAVLPDHRVAVYADPAHTDPGAFVADAVRRAGADGGPVVIWLDDPPFPLLAGFTEDVVAAVPDGWRILVTVRPLAVALEVLPRPAERALMHPDRCAAVGPLSADETDDPAEVGVAVGRLRLPVAEVAAAVDLDRAPPADVLALRTATDWGVAGVPMPLDADFLADLAMWRLREGHDSPYGDVDRTAVHAAVGRATRTVVAGRPLLDWTRSVGLPHLVAHPLLSLVRDAPVEEGGWRTPVGWYRGVVGTLRVHQRELVGRALAAANDRNGAYVVLGDTHPVDVHGRTAHMIAEVALSLKDYTVAQRWFQILADDADDTLVSVAHLRLGMLCRARGHLAAARRHFTAIGERSTAALSLGEMAQEAGDLDGARTWFERAHGGDAHPDDLPIVAAKLAGVAQAAGDAATARRWWREVAAGPRADLAEQARTALTALDRGAPA